MKKIFFSIITVFFICLNANAQNNLEFNQIIKQSYAYTFSNGLSFETTLTVPQGKVIKIVSATLSPVGSNTSGSSRAFIDNHLVSFMIKSANSTYDITENNSNTQLPLWLPSGTYTVQVFASTSGFFSYNGIEFNIVP